MLPAQLETIHLPDTVASYKFFIYKSAMLGPYWHYHPELEIAYVQKGKGIRYVGDNIGSFEEGELILLGENLPHDRITKEEGVVYVFQFSKKVLQKLPECNILLPLIEEAQKGLLYLTPTPKLIKKIVTFEQLPPLKGLLRFFEILHLLKEDINKKTLSSISFTQNPLNSEFKNKIWGVTKFILEHLAEPISVTQLAKYSQMTPNAFCRWFKQSVGYSFVTYLNNARIERACQYLVQTDLKISQIAYATGFESISNFNRTFKKIKKETPLAYKIRAVVKGRN